MELSCVYVYLTKAVRGVLREVEVHILGQCQGLMVAEKREGGSPEDRSEALKPKKGVGHLLEDLGLELFTKNKKKMQPVIVDKLVGLGLPFVKHLPEEDAGGRLKMLTSFFREMSYANDTFASSIVVHFRRIAGSEADHFRNLDAPDGINQPNAGWRWAMGLRDKWQSLQHLKSVHSLLNVGQSGYLFWDKSRLEKVDFFRHLEPALEYAKHKMGFARYTISPCTTGVVLVWRSNAKACV